MPMFSQICRGLDIYIRIILEIPVFTRRNRTMLPQHMPLLSGPICCPRRSVRASHCPTTRWPLATSHRRPAVGMGAATTEAPPPRIAPTAMRPPMEAAQPDLEEQEDRAAGEQEEVAAAEEAEEWVATSSRSHHPQQRRAAKKVGIYLSRGRRRSICV